MPIYGERNGSRLPDYHRLDLSATLKAKAKANRRNDSWSFFPSTTPTTAKNALSVDLLPVRDQVTGNVPGPTDVRAMNCIFRLIPSNTSNSKTSFYCGGLREPVQPGKTSKVCQRLKFFAMNRILLMLSCLTALLYSCQEEIELDDYANDPRLVVEGGITSSTGAMVKLSLSRDYRGSRTL